MNRIVILFLAIANVVALFLLISNHHKNEQRYHISNHDTVDILEWYEEAKSTDTSSAPPIAPLASKPAAPPAPPVAPLAPEVVSVTRQSSASQDNNGNQCATISFSSRKNRKTALDILNGNAPTEITWQETKAWVEENFYQIIIPTDKSLSKARSISKILSSQSIENYIILEKKNLSSVSLGVYKKKNTANKLAKKYAKRFRQFTFTVTPISTTFLALAIKAPANSLQHAALNKVIGISTNKNYTWKPCG